MIYYDKHLVCSAGDVGLDYTSEADTNHFYEDEVAPVDYIAANEDYTEIASVDEIAPNEAGDYYKDDYYEDYNNEIDYDYKEGDMSFESGGTATAKPPGKAPSQPLRANGWMDWPHNLHIYDLYDQISW